jgi:hypothetical protein
VNTRPPRIWIDVECGPFPASVLGSAAISRYVFGALRHLFGPFSVAWVFGPGSAPLARGFYYPTALHVHHDVPRGHVGPSMVLIDDHGDQLWLDGVGCGSMDRCAGSREIVRAAGFDAAESVPFADFDELEFSNGQLAGSRLLTEPAPVSPPGKTAVIDGRLVNRLEFDGAGTTPDDLRALWNRATEPGGWLGDPVRLTLFDSRSTSEGAGRTGCQLVVGGASGRDLWLLLPDPDTYESLSPFGRRQFPGSHLEYRLVVRDIFRTVGVDIDGPEQRSWRQRLLGQHPGEPAVLSWPS